MNLSEVSKFQVLTCLFGVCLIIGIAVVDHKQYSKLKGISKSHGGLWIDKLNTLVKNFKDDASDENLKKLRTFIPTAEPMINLDDDFKKDKDFEAAMKELIAQLATTIGAESSKTEEKLELFQSTLDIIKKFAGSQNYTDVDAKLDDFKTSL